MSNKVIKRNLIIRRLILLFLDSFLLIFSVSLSFLYLQNIPITDIGKLHFNITILGISFYLLTGQYKSIAKYTNSSFLYKLALKNFIIIFISAFIFNSTNLDKLDNKFWILLWFLITLLTCLIRIIGRDLIIYFISKNKNKSRLGIYGDCDSAYELISTLRFSDKYQVKLIFDEKITNWGRYLHGVKIKSPKLIKDSIKNIDIIVIALKSKTDNDKIRDIFKRIEKFNLPIYIYEQNTNKLESSKSKINSLRPLKVEDLLRRTLNYGNFPTFKNFIKNTNVLITGAGGSIGSEVCRQILKLNPKKLIILEISEISLYNISQEIQKSNIFETEVITILGSACDYNLISQIISENKVDHVFHAAAYKHVPLVEMNPIEGIENNVISTQIICEVCNKNNVKNMVLVSTDKAVRPTNVMGASKRIAELIVAAYADLGNGVQDSIPLPKTKFSMVRFGNVLGSSGSVVPLFRKQIEAGGPITITDPEIIRYFMTIPEASELLIQAAGMSEGGEVFHLDMGPQVKIVDLAKQMIKLSGLKLKDKNNPKGDIELVITGLRPGEKLYEELLIDGKSTKTEHPLIHKAKEKFIPAKKLFPILEKFKNDLKNHNSESVFKTVSELVPQWKKFKSASVSK